MSCSDNIQFLRKRKGLTQEQFAEALGVTRQSVSKWESGQSYPEMEKLLQMCDLFGCDLETLVRGSADAAASENDADYEPFMNAFSRAIAGGVALVLLGVTLLVALSMPVGEGIMTMVFLAFLTVAVLLFVLYGIRMESFRREHPRVGALYSAAECRRANSVCSAAVRWPWRDPPRRDRLRGPCEAWRRGLGQRRIGICRRHGCACGGNNRRASHRLRRAAKEQV